MSTQGLQAVAAGFLHYPFNPSSLSGWRALCCGSHLACAVISTFYVFHSTSLNFSPLLHSQSIRLYNMFDPQVLLAPFLVGWVECGVAAMQKDQFAGVGSGWNGLPCTTVFQYR